MTNAMIIDAKDNVAVAIEPIAAGETATFLLAGKPVSVPVTEDITIYHKFAIRDEHFKVKIRYEAILPADLGFLGSNTGNMLTFIPAGAHVHVHNVVSMKEDRRGKE